MKIGYLLQQGFDLGPQAANGPANHVSHLVEQLERLGHHVKIVNGLHGSVYVGEREAGHPGILWRPSGARLAPSLAERGFRRIQTQLGLPYLNLFESLRFARACRESCQDVDVIVERLSWTGYGGSWAAARLGKPHIMEYNGDPLHDLDAKGMGPRGVQRWVSSRLMRRTITRASRIVASGEGWRQQIVSRWKIPKDRVVTIQNGTSLLGLLSRADLRCFDDLLEASSDIRFVYLGGFQPWQGVEKLLRAFGGVRELLPGSTLALIGSGPGYEEAGKLATSLGLEGQVQFLGAMSPQGYAPLLANSDIGLSPYCGWAEFEGLKIFDYKAAGLAIIASGKDGQPESVTSGPIGKVVPPCDERKLADAMVELGSDIGLRQEMGQRARLEAETCHSWERTARTLVDEFRSVLSGRTQGQV